MPNSRSMSDPAGLAFMIKQSEKLCGKFARELAGSSAIQEFRSYNRPTGNCTHAPWDPSGEGSHGVARVLRWDYLATAFNPACSARAAALSVASQVNSGSVRPKWP